MPRALPRLRPIIEVCEPRHSQSRCRRDSSKPPVRCDPPTAGIGPHARPALRARNADCCANADGLWRFCWSSSVGGIRCGRSANISAVNSEGFRKIPNRPGTAASSGLSFVSTSALPDPRCCRVYRLCSRVTRHLLLRRPAHGARLRPGVWGSRGAVARWETQPAARRIRAATARRETLRTCRPTGRCGPAVRHREARGKE
jgi:hypothetical protein